MAAALRVTTPVRLFGAASYFRNGRAPAVGVNPFGPRGPGEAQGYAVALGVEWRAHRALSVIGTLDRFAQVGAEEPGVARNVAGVRWVLTAL